MILKSFDGPYYCWPRAVMPPRTRSVEMSLMRLDFVDHVVMNAQDRIQEGWKHHRSIREKAPTKENKYASAIYYVTSQDGKKTWTKETFLHSDTTAGKSRSYFDIERLPDGEIGASWLDIIGPGSTWTFCAIGQADPLYMRFGLPKGYQRLLKRLITPRHQSFMVQY